MSQELQEGDAGGEGRRRQTQKENKKVMELKYILVR